MDFRWASQHWALTSPKTCWRFSLSQKRLVHSQLSQNALACLVVKDAMQRKTKQWKQFKLKQSNGKQSNINKTKLPHPIKNIIFSRPPDPDCHKETPSCNEPELIIGGKQTSPHSAKSTGCLMARAYGN